MSEPDQKTAFWHTVLRALEVDPRSTRSIRGASGFAHPVVSVGVDDARRRVVIVSGEGDARSAALAHGDIQAAMPDVHVMMARPIAVNLGEAARILSEMIGRISIGQAELEWISQNNPEIVQEATKRITEQYTDRIAAISKVPLSAASLNLVAVWKDVIQQLSLIEIEPHPRALPDGKTVAPTLHLRKLVALDPAEVDRSLGVCSLPLYEFSESDVEVLQRGIDLEAAREILRARDIFQYFFPPPDHLALGLAESRTRPASELVADLVRTPEIGHPFGQFEVVDSSLNLNEVVVSLQERGLLVDGEVGVEVTEGGKQLRAQVRFRPREGLLARLANVLSIKVDLSLKDLFKD